MPLALPAAMVASAGIGAAGSIIGGNAQASAANKAANLEQQRYETTRGDLMPYNQGGQQDFAAANKLMTGSPSQVQAQLESLPGYQFVRGQGLKGVQNSAAARGLGVSGAALKGAATYATGLADSTYGEQFNRLLQGASLGENAAAQTGMQGTALANAQGNSLIQGGNAVAGAASGVANAFGSPFQQKAFGMFGNGAGGGDTLASNPNNDLLALAGG